MTGQTTGVSVDGHPSDTGRSRRMNTEQRTGCRVAIRSMGGVEAARLVGAGEPTDVIVLASKVMEQLEAEGHPRFSPGAAWDLPTQALQWRLAAGARRRLQHHTTRELVKQAILEASRISIAASISS